MTYILWIVVAVLWSVLLLIAGYLSGKLVAQKEAEDEPRWSSGSLGIQGEPGPMGPKGDKGDKGDTGPPGPGTSVDEAWVVDMVSRVRSLEERDSLYQDRIKRVEKKAGLNV